MAVTLASLLADPRAVERHLEHLGAVDRRWRALDGVGQLRRHEVRSADEARQRGAQGAIRILRLKQRELGVADQHDAAQRIGDVGRAGVHLGDRRLELKLRRLELGDVPRLASLAARIEL